MFSETIKPLSVHMCIGSRFCVIGSLELVWRVSNCTRIVGYTYSDGESARQESVGFSVCGVDYRQSVWLSKDRKGDIQMDMNSIPSSSVSSSHSCVRSSRKMPGFTVMNLDVLALYRLQRE